MKTTENMIQLAMLQWKWAAELVSVVHLGYDIRVMKDAQL